MSTFATIVTHGPALQLIAPSSPLPGGRFNGERLRWVGVPAGTIIHAFATGSVTAVQSGANHGIPGDTSAAWTLLEFSPLPQMDAGAFQQLHGGLPVQMVLVRGGAPVSPVQDDCLISGATLATAPAGAGNTAFFAVAFQDRICRDPLTWANAIAATTRVDGNWAQFVSDLAALAGARTLRLVDPVGRPLTSGTVSVAIDGGAASPVVLTSMMDGDTGIVVPDASHATVTFGSAANPVVAAGISDNGSFQAPLALGNGVRLAQLLDAAQWLAAPDASVAISRWNPDSNVEPIVDGNPYFARLVQDLRAAKPGGAVELAGWAFVKGSLADSTLDWPLVPGADDTQLLPLVNELVAAGVQVKFLVNQFMQFDSPSLDDFSGLVGVLCAIYAALMPLQAFNVLATDPAGFCVWFVAITAVGIILSTGTGENILKGFAEYSKPMVEALNAAHSGIATWTPYPAAFKDNPLVPQPFTIKGFPIDDLSHLGVYHQKYVNIKAAGGALTSYLGGIDINSDRVDTPLHRAIHPFHDVQVRITGPAAKDVIVSFQERLHLHEPSSTPPIATPGSVPAAGSHLVQIARTYFKAKGGSGTTPFSFAPNGESTPINTIKNAIAQAREFIYIEDQYFTPPDDYVQALIDAADPARGVRALFITCPYQTDQPYGGVRRADVLAQLSAHWTTRLSVGAPFRRYLHPTPGLRTNLGRMRLSANLTGAASQATFGPDVHIPEPPFWAFIGNELVLVHAKVGPTSQVDMGSAGHPDMETVQTVEIVRAGGGAGGWGATAGSHAKGDPVTCIQIPGIYVHAKVMIVDDVFLFAGSSNINRRGLYHDGEMNSFTIPQHLKGDPNNPARILRCRLMAEHLGLPPEMGISLFADPISAIPYFTRPWYIGSRRQPLEFFGSVPPDVSLGTSDTIGGAVLGITVGALREVIKGDLWRSLVDPTTELQPMPRLDGPEYP
jgi:phosphatidylserine/phosphatidylglycerophosphate/cardiolipin synthase-like enzyme